MGQHAIHKVRQQKRIFKTKDNLFNSILYSYKGIFCDTLQLCLDLEIGQIKELIKKKLTDDGIEVGCCWPNTGLPVDRI